MPIQYYFKIAPTANDDSVELEEETVASILYDEQGEPIRLERQATETLKAFSRLLGVLLAKNLLSPQEIGDVLGQNHVTFCVEWKKVD